MKKSTQRFIITCFFGWLGIHKFMDKKIGMGLIYLFTLGIFGIGWLLDIIVSIITMINDSEKVDTENEIKANGRIKLIEVLIIIFSIVLTILTCGFAIPFILIAWFIYQNSYYKSNDFLQIKESIKEYINDCNDLNEHIEELKNTYVYSNQIDYGRADYIDNSLYNYKRPELKKIRETKNIYNCSLSVCRNAQLQPFKYVCKYFNISANEDVLSKFENVLNNFSAAEQGKILLKDKRDEIIASIIDKVPFFIKKFGRNKLIKKLGFNSIDFSQLYFPKFVFNYVSAGGNSSMKCEVVLDIDNLNRFINYLSSMIKFRKSVAGQRALMTSSLREKIKKRDNYACKKCGISTKQEPHLLLEIDHIIPLSKNGMTTEENLQTLCWKCNRSKGSKFDI